MPGGKSHSQTVQLNVTILTVSRNSGSIKSSQQTAKMTWSLKQIHLAPRNGIGRRLWKCPDTNTWRASQEAKEQLLISDYVSGRFKKRSFRIFDNQRDKGMRLLRSSHRVKNAPTASIRMTILPASHTESPIHRCGREE